MTNKKLLKKRVIHRRWCKSPVRAFANVQSEPNLFLMEKVLIFSI